MFIAVILSMVSLSFSLIRATFPYQLRFSVVCVCSLGLPSFTFTSQYPDEEVKEWGWTPDDSPILSVIGSSPLAACCLLLDSGD